MKICSRSVLLSLYFFYIYAFSLKPAMPSIPCYAVLCRRPQAALRARGGASEATPGAKNPPSEAV
jgi:hypothetical protein